MRWSCPPIAEDGLSAVINPKGDGEVYARCGVKNGGEHIALFSALPLMLEGYGKLLLNPYEFIKGGLYNRSNTELGNGNDRGVATARQGKSFVGFADLDFGTYGSDELTLSIFAMGQEPFTFEIWEGMPDDGGELL